jgi:hypothetical protein
VDTRTNLYYLQTDDLGTTWQTAEGRTVSPPLAELDNDALVRDYRQESRLVYIHDMTFDAAGDPVILYTTSIDYRPGPGGEPRIWTIAHWTGGSWAFHEVTQSTHNYDVGALYVEEDGIWRIVGPTEPGPQRWGTGGEVAIWISADKGQAWKKLRDVTTDSERNHAYVRRPINAHPDFYAFWADGNPDSLSVSHLYFCNRAGEEVWELPYEMEEEFATPRLWRSETGTATFKE